MASSSLTIKETAGFMMSICVGLGITVGSLAHTFTKETYWLAVGSAIGIVLGLVFSFELRK